MHEIWYTWVFKYAERNVSGRKSIKCLLLAQRGGFQNYRQVPDCGCFMTLDDCFQYICISVNEAMRKQYYK